MTRGLLLCLLVLAFGARLQAAQDEPDDAYAWLEEVTGDKALAWVKERDAESTGEFTRADQFQALDRRLLEILDSDARIPMIFEARRRSIGHNSGATPATGASGSGGAPLWRSSARPSPRGKPSSTWTNSPSKKRRIGSGGNFSS